MQRFPEVDLVVGPQYANRLGDLLEDVMNGNQVLVCGGDREEEEKGGGRRRGKGGRV